MSRRIAVSVLIGLFAGSCGGDDPEAGVHALRVRLYSNLAELAEASDAVAVVEPEAPGVPQEVGALPVTITRVRVVRLLSGELPSVVNLRQAGSSDHPIIDSLPSVVPRRQYVAFLRRHTDDGQTTDFWPTGAAGLFESTDSGFTFTRLDPLSSRLPTRITVDDVVNQIAGVELRGLG